MLRLFRCQGNVSVVSSATGIGTLINHQAWLKTTRDQSAPWYRDTTEIRPIPILAPDGCQMHTDMGLWKICIDRDEKNCSKQKKLFENMRGQSML
eukprot:g14123.t1